MTQREAIFKACEELNVRSSLPEVSAAASRHYGSFVHPNTCCKFRQEYRKKKKLKVDCRTYSGQPRRNMLNDKECTLPQLERLNLFFRRTKVAPAQLYAVIGEGKDKFAP